MIQIVKLKIELVLQDILKSMHNFSIIHTFYINLLKCPPSLYDMGICDAWYSACLKEDTGSPEGRASTRTSAEHQEAGVCSVQPTSQCVPVVSTVHLMSSLLPS